MKPVWFYLLFLFLFLITPTNNFDMYIGLVFLFCVFFLFRVGPLTIHIIKNKTMFLETCAAIQ